jgi:hypothetical protein
MLCTRNRDLSFLGTVQELDGDQLESFSNPMMLASLDFFQ